MIRQALLTVTCTCCFRAIALAEGGTTNGQAMRHIPANKTTDHWANLTFAFGLRF